MNEAHDLQRQFFPCSYSNYPSWIFTVNKPRFHHLRSIFKRSEYGNLLWVAAPAVVSEGAAQGTAWSSLS